MIGMARPSERPYGRKIISLFSPWYMWKLRDSVPLGKLRCSFNNRTEIVVLTRSSFASSELNFGLCSFQTGADSRWSNTKSGQNSSGPSKPLDAVLELTSSEHV
jgi:hypothetical protein